jgi:hypothetical protein
MDYKFLGMGVVFFIMGLVVNKFGISNN